MIHNVLWREVITRAVWNKCRFVGCFEAIYSGMDNLKAGNTFLERFWQFSTQDACSYGKMRRFLCARKIENAGSFDVLISFMEDYSYFT